jgi:phenol hydroxylase P3 protein
VAWFYAAAWPTFAPPLTPKGWDVANEAADHVSHQLMLGLYQWSYGTSFHAWIPTDEDMAWLSEKYPDTFDRYYRPRWEHIRKMAEAGTPYQNLGLAQLCNTCQLPAVFTEPGDPTSHCHREVEFEGETYHFCSDGCRDIFLDEPEKYVQSWLPMPQLFAEPTYGDVAKWMEWVGLQPGVDNGDYHGSQDEASFEAWKKHQSATA